LSLTCIELGAMTQWFVIYINKKCFINKNA